MDRHVYETEKSVRVTHYPDVYNNEKITKDTSLPMGTCSDEEFNKFKLEREDILITKDSESPDDIGVPCLIEEDLENTVCGYHLGIIRKTTDIHSPFYFRYLQSELVKGHFYCESSGITRFGLGKPSVENLKVPVPNNDEQKRISLYLDKKTEQIDSLIEKIQKKIELLKEQRTSLINQCVTKGLDPNVEMKDSGVEWIGEIPKHWKMNRLCNLGRFKKGKNITKNDLVEVGHPVILYSHLYTTYQRTVTDPKFFISSDIELDSTKIYKNTFLFTSSGESREDIGKCLLFLGIETSVGGDQVIFELNNFENFDPVFFSFTFNSEFCVHQKSSNSRGEIVVHIYEKQLREIRVPVPPLNEQFEIREKLVDFENTSTKLVDKLETKIKVLKEYRQSLISSVVTGKLRVSEDMV